MKMGNINETQILVLKEHGGYLQVSSIPIEDCSFIINEINSAVKNPKKTLLDVQCIFLNNFNSIYNYYDYLYPYLYSHSYVSGAIRPKKYTYDEYKATLDKAIKEKIKDKNIDNVTKIITDETKSLKQDYASSCIRHIKQQMLYKTFLKVANDPSIKMYSRESIGWNNFEYIITDDLKVSVYTNLGYGSASYFTMTISYKGIIIAPCSHIVKYYKANMTEIIHCTRDYYVDKDSWQPMFEFVNDFTNRSLSNPESIVESYIMNEIDEMMEGLRNIMSNPSEVINMFKTQKTNLSDYLHLRLINPLNNDEKLRFDVFPNEMPIIFKSEKLAQATKTLERLKELSEIHSKTNTYIEEILNMVIKLNPDIEKTIKNIQIDIDKLISQRIPKENLKESLQTQINKFELELDNILEKLPKDADWMEKFATRKQYEEEHPMYVDTKEMLQKTINEISEINYKIYSRNSLIERLSSCANDFTLCLLKAS